MPRTVLGGGESGLLRGMQLRCARLYLAVTLLERYDNFFSVGTARLWKRILGCQAP